MTQDRANELYRIAKETIERQRAEAIELAKMEINLQLERDRQQLNEAKYLKEQHELAQKINEAAIESEKGRVTIEIEKEATIRLNKAEQMLKENIEKAREMEQKLQDEKVRQDQELRQKDLNNDEHQKQRDQLDKIQEQAKKEMQEAQAKADTECRKNLEMELAAKQQELIEREKAIERQRELERQKQQNKQQ